ncbi:hypothetical protein BBbe_11550 [Bartonella bovis 91-4]|uniref:Uncharacterized protein n=1 Tax=Bartonella bovis 91-4 TaxID=1094491 RepID=N6VGL6_9HYPH|nr:hypothetical protein BBbe_11550 [Bartonella bovis 91-4]
MRFQIFGKLCPTTFKCKPSLPPRAPYPLLHLSLTQTTTAPPASLSILRRPSFKTHTPSSFIPQQYLLISHSSSHLTPASRPFSIYSPLSPCYLLPKPSPSSLPQATSAPPVQLNLSPTYPLLSPTPLTHPNNSRPSILLPLQNSHAPHTLTHLPASSPNNISLYPAVLPASYQPCALPPYIPLYPPTIFSQSYLPPAYLKQPYPRRHNLTYPPTCPLPSPTPLTHPNNNRPSSLSFHPPPTLL